MNKATFSKHPLLTGTLLLTLAGLFSRIIGFFYRIFLSHTIGAEGLGIYQLIFPVYALTFSFTVAGIQTAVSKYVAEACAAGSLPAFKSKQENRFPAHGNKQDNGFSTSKSKQSHTLFSSKKEPPGSFTYLYAGLFLSLLLSFLCMFFLYHYADVLAVHVLGERRCTSLLRILALTIPFGAIHSCINGYYYGLQRTAVPAVSQLFEQLARVGCVYLLYFLTAEQGKTITIEMAVWGLVAGEIASVLYSVSFTRFQKSKRYFSTAVKQVFTMSLPLTASRVLINLFQSVEAIMIPGKLQLYGYQPHEALSVFGVMTGMAMPMVFFPSAITNSVSVMLLPAVSEAAANGDIPYIKNAIKKSCIYCITLGLACTLGFLLFGRWLGWVVFANKLAGTFIVILGWICPFLYLTTTLGSILNGLGKTSTTLVLNLLGSGIRILFVIFVIPLVGIKAYLWGMLVSHLVVSGTAILVLKQMVWQ